MGETRQDADLKEQFREHYAERAVAATQGQPCGCGCSCSPAVVEPNDELARGLYSVDETSALPDSAVLASLGCGNPTALAESTPAKSSWTSAAAAASTCCSPPAASARPARSTVWT